MVKINKSQLLSKYMNTSIHKGKLIKLFILNCKLLGITLQEMSDVICPQLTLRT